MLEIILGLIGGLGLFLYGINLMGDALQSLAGNKMKMIIEKLTNNVFVGILVGAVVTGIIQSSSGTTALSISLIRAGLMTMPQAIGIIMGANIGTTATAFLFSFPAISDYSLFFVGIGAILIFFIRNKKVKSIGQIIFGFGLLFFGMDLMGDGLTRVVEESAKVKEVLASFSDRPILGLLTGAVVTMIVQSSSATTGIVQSLVDTDGLTISGALPIIFGNNIGTTITAVIAALGGSIAAKRASAFHVFFNVFGSILFMIILVPFTYFIEFLQELTGANNRMAIAYAHFTFNLVNTLILVWFVDQIIWFIKQIIKGKEEDYSEAIDEAFNEDLIEQSPALALASTKNVILQMSHIVKKMLEETMKYAKEPSGSLFEEVKTLETIINSLDHKIHEYLVKITSSVDDYNSKVLSKYLDTIRDLERIGDHSENLIEVFQYIHENKGTLTEDAWQDFDEMCNTVLSMLNNCILIIENNDKKLAEQVIEVEESVDRMEKKSRKRHTNRVNDGICTSDTGIMFIELLSNLERIGDHCCNIAEYELNEQYYQVIDEPEADLSKKDVKVNIKPYNPNK
ncbi:MAG: Na+/Pi-cotransporter [Haloplasmataceae bacterium]|nr:Na+/Pi-cotransporter [Haloplasmataceae bacterium]